MKVLERLVEGIIRQQVDIDSMQFGFMPGCSTTDAIFIVRKMFWTDRTCCYCKVNNGNDKFHAESTFKYLGDTTGQCGGCFVTEDV